MFGRILKHGLGIVAVVLVLGSLLGLKIIQSEDVVTREFWIAPQSATVETNFGNFRSTMINSGGEVFFNFTVPADFTSLSEAVVVVVPDATETIQWDLNASVAADGQDQNADDRTSLNETLAVTNDLVTDLDVSSVLTGLVASDYVGLNFESDTTNIRIVGLRIKYN